MHRTSSSWPSRVLRQAPHSMSHKRIVLSELPDTTSLLAKLLIDLVILVSSVTQLLVNAAFVILSKLKPIMVLKTRDAPLVTVQGAHELTRAGRPHLKRQSWHNFVISSERKSTLMVLSPLAETMYLSSKSTTFTAARCPTNTLLKLISVGLTMSHTWKVESCSLVPMSFYYFRLPLILGFYRNAPVLAAGDHHPVAELGILQKKQSMHNFIYAQRWYPGCYKQ